MFSNFTEEARNIIVDAKIEMMGLKHPYVGSEHLLLAILKNKNNVSEKLKEHGLTYTEFKTELINIIGTGSKKNELLLFTPLLKRILETATLDSKEQNEDVTVENLFMALLEEGEGIAIRIMMGMNIDIEELNNIFMYHPIIKKNNLPTLINEIGIDLTHKALEENLDPVIGREKEITRILEILSRRTKNNPLLIGEAGVGKTAIVEELSKKIANNEVPVNLKNKKIISIDTASLVAGTKYRGEFEDKIKKIITEVEENNDIILFIDEIHTLVGAGGAEGAIDASNILKPSLARGKLRIIGATTIDEYKKYVEKDRALDRRFQKIDIETPNEEETKNILLNLKTIYEKHHRVNISEDIINLIVELSEKYVYDRNQPDKAIDILDEVCASVSIKEDKKQKECNSLKQKYESVKKQKIEALTNNDYKKAYIYKTNENNIADKINSIELNYNKKTKKVTKEDVALVVSNKTKIPMYELLSDNKKSINQFVKKLHKKIIGQDKAIEEVTNYLKKIRLGYKNNKCYSMLFVGPSGVGKTLLAKTFGSMLSKKVIKLDMSEYSESYSVSKIIGSPPGYVGYENYTNVLEEIRTNPYSVLILDEIERAHPNVLNLFFNILEEGKIKDASSKEIRFDNVCIIMTSNIGFEEIHIGFNKKTEENINGKLQEYFSVPFLNRIDNTIIFENLNDKSIDKLINIKIEEIKNKYKDCNIKISNNVLKEIKDKTNYQNYGARKIDKIIKDNLTNIIIDKILENKKEIYIESLKKDTLV